MQHDHEDFNEVLKTRKDAKALIHKQARKDPICSANALLQVQYPKHSYIFNSQDFMDEVEEDDFRPY